MNPTLAKYFLRLYLEKRNAAGRTYEGAEHMRGPNTSIAFKSLMIFFKPDGKAEICARSETLLTSALLPAALQ